MKKSSKIREVEKNPENQRGDSKQIVALKVLVTYLIFMAGFNASRLTGPIIIRFFPDRPIVDDLLFRILPYHVWLEYLADIIILVLIFGGLFLMLKVVPKKITAYFSITGVAYVIRACINMLTPLDKPSGELINNGLTKLIQGTPIYERIYYQMGMFTSGHIMLATLIYLYLVEFLPKQSNLRVLLNVAVFAEGLLLVWSRGHYSIDVLGGWALAILVYRYLRQPFKVVEVK